MSFTWHLGSAIAMLVLLCGCGRDVPSDAKYSNPPEEGATRAAETQPLISSEEGISAEQAVEAEPTISAEDRQAIEDLRAVLNDYQYKQKPQRKGWTPRQVRAIVALLDDESPIVRLNANETLLAVGEPAAAPLMMVLKNPGSSQRKTAAYLLSHMDPVPVDALLPGLASNDAIVLEETLWALTKAPPDARITEAALPHLAHSSEVVRTRAFEVLTQQADAKAIAPVLAAIKQGRIASPWVAMQVERFGRSATLPVLELLNEKDAKLRATAIDILGRLKDPRAIDALGTLLSQKSESEFHAVAVDALGQIGDAKAGPALRAALLVNDAGVRQNVIKALGLLKDAQAVPALAALLKLDNDEDTNYKNSPLRVTAIIALGEIGSKDAVDALIRALALDSYNEPRAASRALGRIGADAVEPLRAALYDPDLQRCGLAAQALGMTKDPRAVAPLVTLLDDPREGLFVDAMAGLREIGAPAVPPIVEAIQARVPVKAVTQMMALGEIGGPAFDALLSFYRGSSEELRLAAASALVRSERDERVDKLVSEAVEKKDLKVVAEVHFYLIRKGDESAVAALIDCLNQYGGGPMASNFVNSGHSRLQQAARDWAAAHGFIELPTFQLGGATWGRR